MKPRRIWLSRTHLSHIEAHAKSALPREACGVLLGAASDNDWRVSGIEASRNVAPQDRHDRFEIDPALLMRLQKASRAGGPPMIGVYHSHPNGKAEPSETDLTSSWQTGWVWLITAIDGLHQETRAFARERAEFVPVLLEIMETK